MSTDPARSLISDGLRLAQAGDVLGAEVQLRAAMALEPRSVETLGELADAFHSIDLFPESRQCVLQMQALYEREGYGNVVGVAPRLMQLGLADEALIWLGEMVKRAPRRPDIWLEIAAVQWRLGDRAAAAESLQTALRADPNLTEARRRLEVVQKGVNESVQRQNDLCELARRAGLDQPGPVLSGPFAGMRYVTIMRQPGTDYAWSAQRIGSYEQELHRAIEQLIARDHDTVLNIGAGSGYYAVGFAFRNPRCRVLAFETDPDKQAACRELAAANGVGWARAS